MSINATTDLFAVFGIDYSTKEALGVVEGSSSHASIFDQDTKQAIRAQFADTLKALERTTKVSCDSWTPTQIQAGNTRLRSEMVRKLSDCLPGMRIGFVSVTNDIDRSKKLLDVLRKKWTAAETTGYSVLSFAGVSTLTEEQQATLEFNLLQDYERDMVMRGGLSEGSSVPSLH